MSVPCDAPMTTTPVESSGFEGGYPLRMSISALRYDPERFQFFSPDVPPAPAPLGQMAKQINVLLEPHYTGAVFDRFYGGKVMFVPPDVRDEDDNAQLEIADISVPRAVFAEATALFRALLEGMWHACVQAEPQITSIGWQQASSYFEDGEPLFMRVYGAADPESVLVDGESQEDAGLKKPRPAAVVACSVLSRLTVPSFYVLAGGNHSRCEVRADGFYAFEWTDHD